MSVRWVTLWVRPSPPVKICLSVRWVTLWVRPPPCENMCVRLLGYIVGASPLMCVLSLEDNLGWILACCLLRFAAFLHVFLLSITIILSKVSTIDSDSKNLD